MICHIAKSIVIAKILPTPSVDSVIEQVLQDQGWEHKKKVKIALLPILSLLENLFLDQIFLKIEEILFFFSCYCTKKCAPVVSH